MKAYSHDLRERVVRAVDQGYQRADIIKVFGVSRATIKRYLKQRRETARLRPRPRLTLAGALRAVARRRRRMATRLTYTSGEGAFNRLH